MTGTSGAGAGGRAGCAARSADTWSSTRRSRWRRPSRTARRGTGTSRPGVRRRRSRRRRRPGCRTTRPGPARASRGPRRRAARVVPRPGAARVSRGRRAHPIRAAPVARWDVRLADHVRAQDLGEQRELRVTRRAVATRHAMDRAVALDEREARRRRPGRSRRGSPAHPGGPRARVPVLEGAVRPDGVDAAPELDAELAASRVEHGIEQLFAADVQDRAARGRQRARRSWPGTGPGRRA